VAGRVEAATEIAPLPVKFDPSRDASRDVEAAMQLVRATNRRVLVEVGGEWCVWCHIMDRFFTANPDVKALRDARFVWLKVNYSKEELERGAARAVAEGRRLSARLRDRHRRPRAALAGHERAGGRQDLRCRRVPQVLDRMVAAGVTIFRTAR